MFYAHTRESDDIKQPLLEHLQNTAALAKKHAALWGGGDFAELCGLVHDIGKYSLEFQARLNGAKASVDHKTAGGKFLYN
ncbi:MAG: CRISPR-associated endonuclease Cas3'', partial [Defluviitaleaceae bacterium]|nr:CRISPR-associated endonuclease Cas3'' [Defluviitaleaceae bacterium]